TAMSSARVFQKMPCGPARPNAVRTPSTNTTSRRSMTAMLFRRLELGAEVLELPAVRLVRLALVLQHDPPARLQLAVTARVEQPPVRVEAVTRRVDGVVWLVVVVCVVLRLRQVGKVGDDQVDGSRERVEQVALQDVDAVGDAEPLGVPARELDRIGIGVGRPDLDV